MKKICLCLAIVLAVTLCLSACEKESSGEQFSLVMTISETLPSCEVFEYKDGKPYCFYAYDTEGECYRVFWTDFDRLQEKAQIVVEYVDLKQLTYDELTSGWTPKYEITATQVREAAEVKLLRYTWDGWGISAKTVGISDVAYDIADALKSMKETGKTVPKISDDVLELGGGHYPAELGTLWIECGGKIYRMTPDLSQICLVDTHFGSGKVLEMTDEFKTNVNNALHYAPYDYYKGTYNPGDKTVELKNVFKADSSVEMRVKSIHIESNDDPKNTIKVELISEVDQEITVWLACQASADNMANGDSKTVQLKKDTSTTIEMTFGGWPNFAYWVYIQADQTKAEIIINPK